MTRETIPTNQAVMRDVLKLIADAPTSNDSAELLLEHACTLTGAQGAAFILFEDSMQLFHGLRSQDLPPSDMLSSAATRAVSEGYYAITEPIANLPYPAFGLVPLLNAGLVVGVLWLAAHAPLDLERDTIPPLVDGLRIIARERLALAHKERVNLNQTESVRIVLHDIRSPLTSMQGFASMLEAGMAGEINEKQLHFVERILAGITTITSLVENIQDAGRYDPETGFYVMQRAPCDLEEIVSHIIQQHIVPAEKQELTLSTDLEEAPIINADRTMIERAITNLIDNAIKYTPNGGQITVGVKRQGDEVVVAVKDTGYGISPENQRMLFERHARIERPEHKRVKGSGLGLFIVRSVAQRHGGRAWVESQEGQGSTFKFSVPITPFDPLD